MARLDIYSIMFNNLGEVMIAYTSTSLWLENIIRPEEVSEHYNVTKGIVSSGILEYGRPGEVHNNYTSGYGIEVNLEIQSLIFRQILAEIERKTCILG